MLFARACGCAGARICGITKGNSLKDMLELKNICFEVHDDGDRVILKDINLTVGDGRFVAVTGPNGSGKSTLAKIIAGIQRPVSGSILLDGEDITSLSVTERARRGIGYAFQSPVRFKGLRVKDLIRIAAGKDISVAEGCKYLSEVGLCARDYIEREVNDSLSGGELKRIEIATVLARGARVAVFDEPEAGIDLWSFGNLIDVFGRMRDAGRGNCILVISHQERILRIADEIVLLSRGGIEASGPRDEMLPGIIGTEAAVSACGRLEG